MEKFNPESDAEDPTASIFLRIRYNYLFKIIRSKMWR
jgi:hypothetical protein